MFVKDASKFIKIWGKKTTLVFHVFWFFENNPIELVQNYKL